MPTILCRVVWAPTYANRNESIFAATMTKPEKHSYANERLNFANERGFSYGFVEGKGDRINLQKLGAARGADKLGGVTVIWFAAAPQTHRPTVVGWYNNATVYRDAQTPNKTSSRKGWTYNFKAKFSDVYAIPEKEREFIVPSKLNRSDKGFIGQRFWFYPESSDRYLHFLERFGLLKEAQLLPERPEDERKAYEEGERYKREVIVSARNPKLVSAAKAKWGLDCQCCGFNFEREFGELGQGFVEVHHKDLLARSAECRKSTVDDVNVLCANCHRMVHRRTPPLSLEALRKIMKQRQR